MVSGVRLRNFTKQWGINKGLLLKADANKTVFVTINLTSILDELKWRNVAGRWTSEVGVYCNRSEERSHEPELRKVSSLAIGELKSVVLGG